MLIQVKSHFNNNGINLCWVGNDTHDSVVFVDRMISHIGYKIARRGEIDLENAIYFLLFHPFWNPIFF